MSDSLLRYFDRELNSVRALATKEFAAANPKIAARLRISETTVDDPHVTRLLEGLAFLAARVHHRLDDDFPELTDALLGVLYPHYLAPVPSCAIAQLQCKAELSASATIPLGLPLDTEPVRGEPCRYHTAYPVTLWPITIETVRLSGLPLAAPANPDAPGAAAVLRIGLTCMTAEASFTTLGVDRLRFFLRAAPRVALALHELLCQHTIGVALADGPNDPSPVILPADAVQPVGFGADEALFPWPARSFSGFRLLSEYFAFPEKFLFIDITRLDAKTLLSSGNQLDIFLYLDRGAPDLERAVGNDALALGCTPIVNLFPYQCEALTLTHTETEYRIEPDERHKGALEIWDVTRVQETRPDGTVRAWAPFYRLGARDRVEGGPAGFYHLSRRDAPVPPGGTDVLLSTFDPRFDAESPADTVLSIDALCTNRSLPADLPVSPRLKLVDGVAAVDRLVCLTAPTAPLQVPLRERGFWRLISHLSIGHLSLVGDGAAADALKEVLRLYDLRGAPGAPGTIDGLLSVSARHGVARVPGERAGSFCRGIDVTLEFDAGAWQASGLYLLASVLDRFLALHATVNSFVRTRVVLRGREGTAAAWPARAGARVLV
ncbi:type VI secretion system baseplate subunit TssF [Rhodopila sp.]|uniref:type VI secretion system baseplate subunit TssF n=1 Tax=Rhodopila sp. TaxID=2480087 RepID=UPI002CDD9B36|nr:type VI secretion system baseplate subunit TssF [Rhodopila sp.]HVZ09631.1 type VI secretion system baseplate subunit TssF [Rhodopila sp.]